MLKNSNSQFKTLNEAVDVRCSDTSSSGDTTSSSEDYFVDEDDNDNDPEVDGISEGGSEPNDM